MAQRRVLEVEKRPEGVAIVRMDVPDVPVNLLRGVDVEAFDLVLDELQHDDAVRAVVFASGKPEGFLAGADLEALLRCRDAAQATSLARSAQRLTNRLVELPKPVVAAIHGACQGPGLEIAVACDGRVASDDRSTRLGQPEIRLGLMPGAGGTQRLPRLIGVQRALDLLLTGRSVRAHDAREMALVDEVVPQAILVDVAAEHALRLAATQPRRETFRERLARLFSREELESLALAENPVGRRVVFDQARRRVLDRTHGHALAQERVLEAVRTGLERGLEAGLDAEA
jgi:3-hydroxyacyl-CoA dehydrogenase/enoyl-CoA hydratase/3-hydroxybutyryl-CoA epimerase